MININYEQDVEMLLKLYGECYNTDGTQRLSTPTQRKRLLSHVQTFARKLNVADSRTYFGNMDRSYLNDVEINRIINLVTL